MASGKDFFVEVAAGSTLFKQGDAGAAMYIIESGQIDLFPAGAGEALISLGPGDCCGEAALLDKQPHTATAVAKSRTRLLRIERAALPEVLRINADVATALLGKFAARIAHLESCLVDAAHVQAPAPPPSKPVAPVAPKPVEASAPAPPPPPAPPSRSRRLFLLRRHHHRHPSQRRPSHWPCA